MNTELIKKLKDKSCARAFALLTADEQQELIKAGWKNRDVLGSDGWRNDYDDMRGRTQFTFALKPDYQPEPVEPEVDYIKIIESISKKTVEEFLRDWDEVLKVCHPEDSSFCKALQIIVGLRETNVRLTAELAEKIKAFEGCSICKDNYEAEIAKLEGQAQGQADNMRHVLVGIKDIINKGLKSL